MRMNKHLTNRRTAGPVPARITTSNSIASRGSTGHSNDQQRGVLPAESRPPPVSVPYKPCGMRLAQKMRVVPHSERVFNACRTDRLENATGMRLAQRVRVVPRSRESIQRMPELARTVRTMAAGPAPAGPPYREPYRWLLKAEGSRAVGTFVNVSGADCPLPVISPGCTMIRLIHAANHGFANGYPIKAKSEKSC